MGICTLCPKAWKEETWKAANSVPKVHPMSTRGSECHARPKTAVSYGAGPLQVEKACCRLLRSQTMMMMMMNRLRSRQLQDFHAHRSSPSLAIWSARIMPSSYPETP